MSPSVSPRKRENLQLKHPSSHLPRVRPLWIERRHTCPQTRIQRPRTCHTQIAPRWSTVPRQSTARAYRDLLVRQIPQRDIHLVDLCRRARVETPRRLPFGCTCIHDRRSVIPVPPPISPPTRRGRMTGWLSSGAAGTARPATLATDHATASSLVKPAEDDVEDKENGDMQGFVRRLGSCPEALVGGECGKSRWWGDT